MGEYFFMVYDIDIHQFHLGPYKNLEFLDEISFWMTMHFFAFI